MFLPCLIQIPNKRFTTPWTKKVRRIFSNRITRGVGGGLKEKWGKLSEKAKTAETWLGQYNRRGLYILIQGSRRRKEIWHLLYCTVLCCTLLYCTVLYCTLLYSALLYSTLLCYTVLYCTVLYSAVLYCAVLYCTVLCCTLLYSTLLYSTILYCNVLYCTDCTVLYFTWLLKPSTKLLFTATRLQGKYASADLLLHPLSSKGCLSALIFPMLPGSAQLVSCQTFS